MGISCKRYEIYSVIKNEQSCYDNGLRNLNAVDTCKDVDAIRAEDGNRGHVRIV